MSDVREQQAQKAVFFSVKQETLRMKERLEQGRLPFLPRQDGFADTKGIRSAVTGKLFKGTNQILAKCYLSERGDTATNVLTFTQANNNRTTIKKGEHGFTLSVYDAEKKEAKTYRYFSTDQVVDPAKIPKIDLSSRYQNTDNFRFAKITCFETEPVKYLGKYLTAVSLDCDFVAPPDIAQIFKKKLLLEIDNGIKQENYTKFFEIANTASSFCKEELTAMFSKVQTRMQDRQPQPKLERHVSQSIGR